MGWARLDDQRHQNRKVLAISLEADGLWGRALTWSAANLTDGFVPASALPAIANGDRRAAKLAGELVAQGLWELETGGWAIHDYLVYNPNGATIRAERAAAAERMRANRAKDKSSSESTDAENAGGSGNGNSAAPRHPPGPPNNEHAGGNGCVTPVVRESFGRTPGERSGDVRASFGDPDPDPDVTSEQRAHTRSRRANNPPPEPDDFAAFWAEYPTRRGKKLGKATAVDQWRRLSPDDRAAALVGARHYAASDELPKDAHRWLRDRAWTEWQTPATPDVARTNGHRPAHGERSVNAITNMLNRHADPPPDPPDPTRPPLELAP